MDELLDQFLIEGEELIQQAYEDLLALGSAPNDPSLIDSAFRAVHTLKGSVGLFDLAPMGVALHAAEDLLAAMRDARVAADPIAIDALLACIGASETWLRAIAQTGQLPPDAPATADRIALSLQSPLRSETGPLGPASPDVAPSTVPDWLSSLLFRNDPALQAARATAPVLTGLQYVPDRQCFFRGDDPLMLIRSIPGLVALHIEGRDEWSLDRFDPFTCGLVIEALTTAPIADVRKIFRLVNDQASFAEVEAAQHAPAPHHGKRRDDDGRAGVTRTLRIDAARIDTLADIAGELIVAKNRLGHLATEAVTTAPNLARALASEHADIERLAAEMHRAVMRTRLIPFDQTIRRLPRLVCDIAGKLGKDVQFEVSGAETEADKSVVDGLFEPLLHIVRNALDHGIETPTVREAADKPRAGRIRLQVGRENGQVVIAVTDDGAGIDATRLRRTAKARRVADEATIDAMDDDAVLDMIFAPGFSTAAAVTDVSGRGVGLDAVRTALHGMGGRVTIASAPGAGSTVRLSLPQAVVVQTVVLAEVGTERFGVPIEALAETARIPAERIIPVRDGTAFVLRDQTIPLLRLSDLLGLPAGQRRTADAKVLMVASGDQKIGVEVDGFGERTDVTLRPLSRLLAGTPGALGTALLGDGRVLMVLDLPELLA